MLLKRGEFWSLVFFVLVLIVSVSRSFYATDRTVEYLSTIATHLTKDKVQRLIFSRNSSFTDTATVKNIYRSYRAQLAVLDWPLQIAFFLVLFFAYYFQAYDLASFISNAFLWFGLIVVGFWFIGALFRVILVGGLGSPPKWSLSLLSSLDNVWHYLCWDLERLLIGTLFFLVGIFSLIYLKSIS